MGMVVRSASRSRAAAALALCLVIGGCAARAPALPPPRSGEVRSAPANPAVCEALLQDIRRIDAKMREANARIEAERSRNQAIGYFSAVLFPPAILAAEGHAIERAAITRYYEERDRKLAQAIAAGCTLP